MFYDKKVAFYTLGCKLNFAETSTIARSLENIGFIKTDFDNAKTILSEILNLDKKNVFALNSLGDLNKI